jgi:hypothetical protein
LRANVRISLEAHKLLISQGRQPLVGSSHNVA